MAVKRKVTIGVIIGLAIMAGLLVYAATLSKNRTANADSEKLLGDWVRPDGGYVIRINGIHSDGTVQAAYFNPNPIHVATATVNSQKGIISLFAELQDVGYPGSKYDMVYIRENDVLQGTYFQAQAQ